MAFCIQLCYELFLIQKVHRPICSFILSAKTKKQACAVQLLGWVDVGQTEDGDKVFFIKP
jgi:hypothetical protein